LPSCFYPTNNIYQRKYSLTKVINMFKIKEFIVQRQKENKFLIYSIPIGTDKLRLGVIALFISAIIRNSYLITMDGTLSG